MLTPEQKKSFFNRYKYAAIWEHIFSGVPASITLAQLAIESNYGMSELFLMANNGFGIKAYSNPDNLPVYYANDDLVHEPFRMYPNVRASIADHSNFLHSYHRYDNLFTYTTPQQWADGLQADGYATSPTYSSALMSAIRNNDLQKFDFLGNHKTFLIIILIAIAIIILLIIYKLYKKWRT